ncbi:probable flavin-containing monooxygenase 1 [Cornus florida]|uniref:probable flavin-containing monooxygenase 1 n=1 Tax=Cornus florida TaxID=4283 RepID=UPI00289F5433|nr:probable flavin-containing monooxygenase 1 [Cornus florida]XP_059647392.1 probable flavin-containing monooxygenase 1 [Cornus florida]
MERQVGIIGAGISGLLACKYALSKGYRPIVFESQSSSGGVWTKTLETTKLQSSKLLYQFSDFPWPSSVTEEFPNQHEVLDYVQSYATHFDLLRHIKFNSRVVSISYEGPSDAEEEMQAWSLWGGTGEPFSSKGKWNLTVHDTQTLSTEIYQVDFTILCLGRFSDVPNIPEFPPKKGPEAFHGKVIHAMDYAAMDYASAAEFVKGKRVAVVGLQKSALDIARECSIANGVEHPCTVIYRTEHWNVPDYLPWGVNLGYLYLNRFSELLVHKPNQGYLLALLATIFSPLRWGFSKFVESYIRSKLRLAKFGMVPKHSFLKEVSSCLVSTVPEDFYDRVEKGSIKLKKAPSFSFCEKGLLIDGEAEPLETDMVILATGFKSVQKLKDIFVSPTFQEILAGSTNTSMPLYRECIHPRIPQLAIIGFSESLANLYTSEIRCRWVAELLDGTFKVPSIKEMEKDVEKWDEYLKQSSGEYYKRSCIGALHIWYNDQLCNDMGWNPRRKKGFIAELFEPYGPMDYTHP